MGSVVSSSRSGVSTRSPLPCPISRSIPRARHAEAPPLTSSSPSSPLHTTSSPSSQSYPTPLALMEHLDSSSNPAEVAQTHSRLIRTDGLASAAAFHWNCLMRSYLRSDFPRAALCVYVQMARHGVLPDSYSLPIALKAACQLFAVSLGLQLHSTALRVGLERNEYCESGLISVYCKWGEFEAALRVFDENGERKLGSWNSMISGLAQGGRSEEVISMFVELRRSGLRPDDVTMVSVLSACGSLGDLGLAQQMHKCVLQAEDRGIQDIMLPNALVDMYGKCGRTDLAYRVFSRMTNRNVSTWTAMIMGLAMHGHVNEALEFFQRMRIDGIRPNHVTFVCVLSACAHGGLVDAGMDCFNMMTSEYNIDPTIAHYGCMVDLLGRIGRLEDAKAMVERMPMNANSVILGTLLGACEKHVSVKVGKWTASKLIELEPWNDGVYVVLSNIYANACMWDEVEKLRILMKEMKVAKMPAYSLATIPI